jgi:hypothetical protein
VAFSGLVESSSHYAEAQIHIEKRRSRRLERIGVNPTSGERDRLSMSRKKTRHAPNRVLRLPDLDFARSAVLNTLRSSESKRSYRFAIDDFVAWYRSEPPSRVQQDGCTSVSA